MARRCRLVEALTGILGLLVIAAVTGPSAYAGRAPADGAPTPARSVRGPTPTTVGAGRRVPSSQGSPNRSTVGPFADFNGDGRGDLAVGIPGQTVAGQSGAGQVSVIYGSTSGLGPAFNQLWSQNSAGVLGTAEDGDAFGSQVTVGDFNGDGFTDLAIGVPDEGLGDIAQAGAVDVIYGSSSGLSATGNQLLDQDTPGVRGIAEQGDQFGSALASRDFNGDGFTDLAVGVPNDDAGPAIQAGVVNILYGSPLGLGIAGNQLVAGGSELEAFGTSLAAGNFDGQGPQDLAVGAPGAGDRGQGLAGAVFWASGSPAGLLNWRKIHDTVSAPSMGCGDALASYNRNNDGQGFADLAVGCPFVSEPGQNYLGAVDIHFGSSTGLGDGARRVFSPDPQPYANFGASLAAADFGNDGSGGGDDLAVGEPERDVGGAAHAGRVVVFSVQGHVVKSRIVRQGLDGTIGTPEEGDEFGEALTTGNFNGDHFADLAVGVPSEGIGSVRGAGGVNVLYGSSSGITTNGNQFFSQGAHGMRGVAQRYDSFGGALSGRNE